MTRAGTASFAVQEAQTHALAGHVQGSLSLVLRVSLREESVVVSSCRLRNRSCGSAGNVGSAELGLEVICNQPMWTPSWPDRKQQVADASINIQHELLPDQAHG